MDPESEFDEKRFRVAAAVLAYARSHELLNVYVGSPRIRNMCPTLSTVLRIVGEPVPIGKELKPRSVVPRWKSYLTRQHEYFNNHYERARELGIADERVVVVGGLDAIAGQMMIPVVGTIAPDRLLFGEGESRQSASEAHVFHTIEGSAGQTDDMVWPLAAEDLPF